MLSKRIISKVSSSQAGSHILEFSLVVGLLFFLVAGAFDINSALQSYTSLQEGVNRALRCSYTTDGACVETDPGTRDRLFRVTQFDTPTTKKFINQFDYKGEASWFQKTILTISPSVTSLETVKYKYRDVTNKIPASGTINPPTSIPIWLQTDFLPFVDGDGLDPDFNGYPRNAGVNYFPQKKELKNNKGESLVAGMTNKTIQDLRNNATGVPIGSSHSFSIPDPFASNPGATCYIADENGLPSKSKCEQDKKEANILIHVKGTVSGNGHGAVMIKVKEEGDKARPLGGRLINGGDYAHDNFTTRGLLKVCKDRKCEYKADPNFVDQYNSEAKLYKNLKVPYNKNFTLDFEIISNDGSEIGWSLDEIKIFTSRYEPRSTDEKGDLINETIKEETITCPENYGTDDTLNNCLEICPVQDPRMVAGSAVCSIVSAPKPEFEFEPTCANPTLDRSDWPAYLQDYSIVNLNQKNRSVDVFTDHEDPIDYLTKDGNLCPAFPIVTKIIDQKETEGANVKLNTGSHFAGVWPDLGCGWETILKNEALNDLPQDQKIPVGAFFKADRVAMGHVDAGNSLIDTCMEFGEITIDAGPAKDLGTMAYSDIPAHCLKGEKLCKYNFLGYTAGTEAAANLNGEEAINSFGIPEIQNTFPRADFSKECQAADPYCTKFTRLDKENKEAVTYSARMRVPMYTLNLLGIDGIDVSYTDSHKLEKIYSK